MSNMTSPDERALCERATQGEWYWDKRASDNGAPIIRSPICWLGTSRDVTKVLYHNGSDDPEVDANAAFIATFHPAMVLALLDRIEALERDKQNDCSLAEQRVAALEIENDKLKGIIRALESRIPTTKA